MDEPSDAISNVRELVGWKQIAGYLGDSIPTAKKLFKEEGLPVKKRGGRYYAFTDEIDRWKRQGGKQPAPEADRPEEPLPETPADEPAVPPRAEAAVPRAVSVQRGLLTGILVLGIALTLSVLAVFFQIRRGDTPKDASLPERRGGDPPESHELEGPAQGDRAPESYDFDGSRLWILDAEGRRTWSILADKIEGFGRTPPLLADVDGDGLNEVLFNKWALDKVTPGSLICFDDDSEVLWEFTYGRELTMRGRYFKPFYFGERLELLETDLGTYVLTVARHSDFYPCQVALLDPASGELVSEYWHPGWIYAVEKFDVDQDGTEELLVGGANNPDDFMGRPGLAVLSIPFAEPAGDENFFGAWNQRELKYLVFPMIDVFEVQGRGFSVLDINADRPDRLEVLVGRPPATHYYYYLDHNLRVIDMQRSDLIVTTHDDLFREGQLNHAYSRRELEDDWGRFAILPTAPDGGSPGIE